MTTADQEATGAHDWLYRLLPAVHRRRDAELGEPLRALLALAAEQLDVVRNDITGLYDDWFIETCRDWVVPYLGELVGFTPAVDVAPPQDDTLSRDLARVLFPRAQVGRTIGNRRRRGTLAILETLARDTGGWPARAVEFSRLIAVAQSCTHPQTDRGRLVDLRDGEALRRLGGPFESTAHIVDTRGLTSRTALGRHGPHSVAVFVWRLQAVPVTFRRPYAQDAVGPHCYTFSVIGIDTTLFGRGHPGPTVDELSVPAPLRRRTFERRLAELYGEDRDVAIWWVPPTAPSDTSPYELIPREKIIVADLDEWTYRTPPGKVAVDPERGRIAFPAAKSERSRRGVRVSYCYGSPAAIGGGECARDAPPRATDTRVYRVGTVEAEEIPFRSLADALARWRLERPVSAVVEVADSAVYVEEVAIELEEGQSLELRAAPGRAPVLRLLDRETDQLDAFTVVGAAGSCFVLDGFLVTGRGLRVTGELAHLRIRHSTLVPGWSLQSDCSPRHPAKASLDLDETDASVRVEHSILGAIRVAHDEVRHDPVPIELTDSVLDATAPAGSALANPDRGIAHARLVVRRCTVFGEIHTHAVDLAENSIFRGQVRVARRQVGCVRFCSVPSGSRTPRRHRCQPDLGVAALEATLVPGSVTDADRAALVEAERLRLRPDVVSDRYGTPAYAQLATICADEIRTGADDRSEMGVHHDLFTPQRLAGVEARLRESTPAGVESAVVLVT